MEITYPNTHIKPARIENIVSSIKPTPAERKELTAISRELQRLNTLAGGQSRHGAEHTLSIATQAVDPVHPTEAQIAAVTQAAVQLACIDQCGPIIAKCLAGAYDHWNRKAGPIAERCCKEAIRLVQAERNVFLDSIAKLRFGGDEVKVGTADFLARIDRVLEMAEGNLQRIGDGGGMQYLEQHGIFIMEIDGAE